jgi:glycosyl transferase family 25
VSLPQPDAAGPLAGIPIYVINLDRSPERLEHVRRGLALKGLSPVRIRAVDANDLDARAIAEVFDAERAQRDYFVPISKAEIACFLSHRFTWRAFLEESRAPVCVILEDDAELSDAFVEVIAAVAARGPRDWDMVKLFARRRQCSRRIAPLPAGFSLVRHLRQPTVTVGQMVSRSGAEKMLGGSQRIYRPIDVQLQFWWELGVRILSVDPPLVQDVSRNLGGSTIRDMGPRQPAERIAREWRRFVFRSVLLIKSVYHQVLQR